MWPHGSRTPMSSSPDSQDIWIAIGAKHLLRALAPLRDAHARRASALLMSVKDEHIVETLTQLAERFSDHRVTVLVVEDPASTSLRPQFITPLLGHRSHCAVGWLRLNEGELRSYAVRAASILRRTRDGALPVALLGARENRYRELISELETIFDASRTRVFNWSAERIRPEPMIRGLRSGMGAVLHMSHGASTGWFAYDGITAKRLCGETTWIPEQSCSWLFSLACRTGSPQSAVRTSRADIRRGFADEIVAAGIAGTVLAPIGDPLHLDNRWLAHALSAALASGHREMIDVLGFARARGASLEGYCLIGDPRLPAACSADALARAEAVIRQRPQAAIATPAAQSALG